MRRLSLVLALALGACSSPPESPEAAAAAAAPAAVQETPPASPRPTAAPVPAADGENAPGAFAGSWQACEGAPSPDQCSRYLLQQRGDRICGTWSYFATGAGYQGRVIARAVSSTEARRIHICGRVGSETRSECEAGWESIDKPLRLCGGKLGDLDGADGTCFADFEPAPDAERELAALAAEPWMQACLAGDERGDPP